MFQRDTCLGCLHHYPAAHEESITKALGSAEPRVLIPALILMFPRKHEVLPLQQSSCRWHSWKLSATPLQPPRCSHPAATIPLQPPRYSNPTAATPPQSLRCSHPATNISCSRLERNQNLLGPSSPSRLYRGFCGYHSQVPSKHCSSGQPGAALQYLCPFLLPFPRTLCLCENP